MIQVTKTTDDKIPYARQVANEIDTYGYTLVMDITGGYEGAFVPSLRYTYSFDSEGLRKDIIDYVQATIPTTTSSD